jgi:putative SOS response-associated peptidase YedK
MPVVLTKETMWDWLEQDYPKVLESLLRPLPDGSLRAYQVSRDVNSPQNQGEYLVEPVEEGLPGIL